MNILVIGRGGREHAIIDSLKKSEKVKQIYCAPGNDGIKNDAICIPINEEDFDGLVNSVNKFSIDLTIVGPEQPLLSGIVDYFRQHNLDIIGPTKRAAQIEGSKSFAKELMNRYNIPTAQHQVFTNKEEAIAYVNKIGAPIVIKADGLAAGKGVVVAKSLSEAIEAIEQIMEDKIFGSAGEQIVIEEFLMGEEVTIMAFVEGTTLIPMEPAQDHKPIYDDDKGPNTGGMGSYSPVPQINDVLVAEIKDQILEKIVKAMDEEGIYYSGILYAGLIITNEGPKVIEFNARFGDPETQVVLLRLKTDLIDIYLAILNKKLDKIKLEWLNDYAVCVIMASEGYPGKYTKDVIINMVTTLDENNDYKVYFAGVKNDGNNLLTSGGRVLGITSLGDNIMQARDKAYKGIDKISFVGAQYRTDIGKKAILKA